MILKMMIFNGKVWCILVILSSIEATSRRPPLLRAIPRTAFKCTDRHAGYYADMETGCQVYHMCGMNGRKYSYICPDYTLFQQQFMVCDHWKSVNCSNTAQFYDLNLKIGKVPDKTSNGKKSVETPIASTPTLKEKIPKIKEPSETLPEEARFIPLNRVHLPPTILVPPTFDPITATAPLLKPVYLEDIESNALPTQSPPINFPSQRDGQMKNLFKIERRKTSVPRRFFGRNNRISSDNETGFEGIKFRPVLVRKRISLFEEESFTIPPEILQTTLSPTSSLLSSEFVEEEINFNALPEIITEAPEIPLFLIPPLPSISHEIPPLINASTFLLPPPPHSPIKVGGHHQEIQTPLLLSRRSSRASIFPFSNSEVKDSISRILVPPLVGGNPDFYIPSPGLQPPIIDNSINEEPSFDQSFNKMTMVFPSGKKRLLKMLPLVNPNCPQCHPAFLLKNKCTPCVIIK